MNPREDMLRDGSEHEPGVPHRLTLTLDEAFYIAKPPIPVRVHSSTAGGLVNAHVDLVGLDGGQCCVWYEDGVSYKWVSVADLRKWNPNFALPPIPTVRGWIRSLIDRCARWRSSSKKK